MKQTLPRAFPIVHSQWVALWSAIFAIGWLLPSSFLPWQAFHQDAWYAFAFLLTTCTLLWRTSGFWALPKVVPPLLALALVPLLQWVGGLIYFAGVAWIAFAYVAAAALVLWCSHRWETLAPGQGLDGLFMAIGIAAFLTVVIQCHQWLGQIGVGNWWVLDDGPARPTGNFAQPNIAATILCWGLCAVAWGAARQYLGYWIAGACAAVLLWGVALTGSRTAWLGLSIVVIGLLCWRDYLPTRQVLWLTLGLSVYFVLCVAILDWLNADAAMRKLGDSTSWQMRLQIWQMTLKALAAKPWWGYGWNQTYSAQLAVADQFPALHQRFTSAHNLVLDLLVWNGLALGLIVILGGVYWVLGVLRRVRAAQDMVLVFFVLLALNHSMLEMPLHYAFMLLPLAWVLGAIEQRMGSIPTRVSGVPKALVALAVGALAVLLSLIVTDYLHVERSLHDKAPAGMGAPTTMWRLPNLRLLTQLRAEMEIAQYDALKKPISSSELHRLEAIARYSPKGGSTIKLAGALAINGEPERARWWLTRMCKVTMSWTCPYAHANWIQAGTSHPEIAAIDWPEEPEDAAKP